MRRNGDPRPCLYVHTDHNPDDVRTFYEVPHELVRLIQPDDDRRTFAQALADLAASKRAIPQPPEEAS